MLITTSRRPNVRSTSAIIVSADIASDTSAWIAAARRPLVSTAATTGSASARDDRKVTATSAPRAESAVARVTPMRRPPVSKTTREERSMGYRLQAQGYGLQAAGCRLQTTGRGQRAAADDFWLLTSNFCFWLLTSNF